MCPQSLPTADFVSSPGVTSRPSPAPDSPLSPLPPPHSHPSGSPCVGLGRPTLNTLLDHKYFICLCLGFFGHCHLCVSSPSVQWGSNSASSAFLQAPPRTRSYLQLSAAFTWLSPEMAHTLHLAAGAHLPVPPLRRRALSDWSSHH